MYLIAQFVKVIWDKNSRGGPSARKRNQVIEGKALPAELDTNIPADNSALVHRIIYSHTNDFETPITEGLLTYDFDELINIGCFHFDLQKDKLEVTYQWSQELGGAPAKQTKARGGHRLGLVEKAFSLRLNQLGRAVQNGRFSDDNGWWYEKLAVNIALVGSIDKNIFLTGRYSHQYKQLSDLW